MIFDANPREARRPTTRRLSAGTPPWGTSQGVPGRGSRLKVCGPLVGVPPVDSHQKSCRFGCRFLVVLGSILGPSWGSFSVMLAPFSAQVGLGTVFESAYLRKSDCSRNITYVFLWFWAQNDPKMGPRSTQDRSKTGPRSSWIAFFSS